MLQQINFEEKEEFTQRILSTITENEKGSKKEEETKFLEQIGEVMKMLQLVIQNLRGNFQELAKKQEEEEKSESQNQNQSEYSLVNGHIYQLHQYFHSLLQSLNWVPLRRQFETTIQRITSESLRNSLPPSFLLQQLFNLHPLLNQYQVWQ